MTVLEISNLKRRAAARWRTALRPWTAFRSELCRRNEILCVVGESGSGKSMMRACADGSLAGAARATARAGEILFERQGPADAAAQRHGCATCAVAPHRHDLSGADDGAQPADDASAGQIEEVIEVHTSLTPRRAPCTRLSRHAGCGQPARARARSLRAYPHQLSGGQRQRAMIAMALIARARRADRRRTDHRARCHDAGADPGADPETCSASRHMAVHVHHPRFRRGRRDRRPRGRDAARQGWSRQGAATEVLHAPQHPYTRNRCIAAVPHPAAPQPTPPAGRRRGGARGERPRQDLRQRRRLVSPRPRGSCRRQKTSASRSSGVARRSALVGESGSGKSTVARCIMRLIEPDAGTDPCSATSILQPGSRASSSARQRGRIQMVFQDPYASLDPRWKVGNLITEGPIDRMAWRAATAHHAHRRAARAGRPRSPRCRPLSARVLRRTAAAHRDRPRAGASTRKCWSPTSRCPRSTSRCRRRFWACLRASATGSASPCCSSPTICGWPPRCATASR